MENENLTEQENMGMDQSGAGDVAQLDMGNPIAGGIVSQMAVQENVMSSGGGLSGDRSLNAESSEAPAPVVIADSETMDGAEPEK